MSSDIWSDVSGVVHRDRPLVLLCHGSMDRSAGLLRLSRQLDHAATVIRYDRRGYGRSGEADGPFSVAGNIADLAAVLDRHAPGRTVDLGFGHSFGGNVVLGLAALEPERFARVAVYETPLSWFDWWPTSTAGGAATQIDDPAEAAEVFMRRLIGDDHWERLPPGTRRDRRSEGAAMVGELADLRVAAPWDEARVTLPVLAIDGEHGRLHHQMGMQRLAALLPDGRHVQLAEAGHAAPNTHAGPLAALLIRFLTEPPNESSTVESFR